MRKKPRFYGLKRPKIRQSWNKYNLYNLSRYEQPRMDFMTFFQQKWLAKASSRAYHGETMGEKRWQNMFRRSIRSVIPMDPHQLARSDGSPFSRGRGSGVEKPPGQKLTGLPLTPYMNMVYAPAERRLDTAIFRAMFASSTRQARQFVVHEYVKVNGKKMIHPGYQLNPGDMFQVEPERVLYATGAPKDTEQSRAGRLKRRKSAASAADSEDPIPTPESAAQYSVQDPKATLSSLLSSAKIILAKPSPDLRAKRKQELRSFQQNLRRALSRPTALSDSIEAQFLELSANLGIRPPPSDPLKKDDPSNPKAEAAADAPSTDVSSFNPKTAAVDALSQPDAFMLREALAAARDNPYDITKPYATPWRPRDYMSPFAFIPRYLEVHHRICSAVYLRHPVARPGLAEVPTPFHNEMNSLAYLWYLRRR